MSLVDKVIQAIAYIIVTMIVLGIISVVVAAIWLFSVLVTSIIF